jgi:hypothetical protein
LAPLATTELADGAGDGGDADPFLNLSPWGASSEGGLGTPAARFLRRHSAARAPPLCTSRSSGLGRGLGGGHEGDDDDVEEEDWGDDPALALLGHDGGGAPLRASYGRVLCALGPHQRVVMVACGGAHSLFATSLGRLYAFGSNARGQLGLGGGSSTGGALASGVAATPQLVVELERAYVVWCGAGAAFSACIAIEAVAAGTPGVAAGAAAVRQRIFTCGANDQGQLGLGGTFTEELAQARSHTKAQKGGFDANGYDTTRGGGSVASFRAIVLHPPPIAVVVKGLKQRNDLAKMASFRAAAAAAEPPASFREGPGAAVDVVPFVAGAEPRAMSCGAAHCAVITMDGRLVTWGANEFGQLGRGFFSPSHGSTTLAPSELAAAAKAGGRGPQGCAPAAARADDEDGGAWLTAAAQVERQQAAVVAAVRERQAEEARQELAEEEAEQASRRRAREAAGGSAESDEDSDEDLFRAALKKKLQGGVKKAMRVTSFGAELKAVEEAAARRLAAWRNTGRPAVVDFADVVRNIP